MRTYWKILFKGLEIQLPTKDWAQEFFHLSCLSIWFTPHFDHDVVWHLYTTILPCTYAYDTYFKVCHRAEKTMDVLHTLQSTQAHDPEYPIYNVHIFPWRLCARSALSVFSGQPNRRGKRPQDRHTSSIIMEITHDYTRTSYSTESPHRYLASIFHLV